MYAIIETGGKQYRVMMGDKIHIEKLDADQGASYVFEKVLFLSGDKEESAVGTPYIEGVAVKGKVLEHTKGDKLIVFKMKRRKKYRSKRGHRQHLTVVEITGIEKGFKKAAPKVEPRLAPKAAPKVEPKPAPKVEPRLAPKAAPKVEPKAAPKVEPKAAPKVEPKAAPKVEPKPAPKPAPKASTTKTTNNTKPKTAPKSAPKKKS
ncbi:MAG: 50S ribosomal protein L21 [Pseudomonadota bacterium]